MLPCVWDKEAISFVNDLLPLIEAGLLIPRPNMMLLALKRQEDKDEARHWQQIDVDPLNPSSIWIADPPEPGESSVPLYSEFDHTEYWRQVANITVPYLQSVPLADLAKILLDEHDLIAEFRHNVRELIKQAGQNPSEVKDIYNDGVRPATDKVNRKFRDIVAIRSIRMGGAAVSGIGLGLLSLTGIGAVSGTLLVGASGLSMLLAREYAEFVKEKRELRNEPFYLLWRIHKESKK